jgi:hypothetical protein
VVLLEELQLAVQYQGARGPVVYVDAAELAAVGPEPLVDEVLAALGLSHSDLAGGADQAAQRDAEELVSRVQEAKAARASQGSRSVPKPAATK